MDRLLSMRVFQRVVDEGSFAAAAQVRMIDHIIMQQRCRMNKFHRRRELILPAARIIEQRRRRERQHRPHPLAPAGNQMAGQFWNKRDLRLHAIENHSVDLIHPRGHKRDHRIERGGCGF